MKRSKWILSSCLMGFWVGISGCSQREEAAGVQDEGEVFPSDLKTMQGSWSAESTDLCSMCTAVFNGYTIRLKYQQTPSTELLKRNISIKSVDTKSKLLLLHNSAGAWSYNLHKVADEEFLELEFYNDVRHSWARVNMKRSS